MLDLSGLASGFSSGMNAGYDLMAKRREMQEQARTQAAQRMIGQGQINAAQGPQPPASMSMPMPGATPMPGAGGPPPMPPQGMGGPGAGLPTQTPPMMPQRPPAPQMPQGGLPTQTPPMMAPGPQGPASPGQPPAAAASPTPQPPAFSGSTQPTGMGDWADSGQTVNRLFQELLKQNPQLKQDPMLLFKAAEQQIGLMKGVGSDQKAMLAAQVRLRQQDIQQQHYEAMSQNYLRQHQDRLAQIDARLKITNLNNSERTHLQQMRDAEMTNIQGMRDAASRYRTDAMVGLGEDRIDSTAATAGARIEELATHDDNMETLAEDRTSVGSMGRDKSSPPAPKLRSRTPTQLPRGGRGGGGQGGSSYKSLAELQAAHQAGRVSTEEARRLAVKNGWAQ